MKNKVYIAGRLRTVEQREYLEKVDELCKKLGFDTFLPHRKIGLADSIKDADRIFRGDIINGFKGCNLMIAVLDGMHVGAGTAWELGYANAKAIPAIGLKTDESIEDALDYLSVILVASMKFVDSLEKLEKELKKFKK